MESPAPIAELVRWQTATLVASAVAALELVLLVVLAVALLGGPAVDKVRAASADRATSREPTRATTPPANEKREPLVARRPRSETEIVVLNGNGITGAASDAADRVRGLGYRIGSVGNAERSDYTRTIVMFRRGYEPAADRLARDIDGALVAPLDGMRPSDLRGAHLVLLLGRS